MNKNIKIVLVGDAKVGKTTFIKRLMTGVFLREYEPTMGVDVTALPLNYALCNEVEKNTSCIVFNVWDCAGIDLFRGLGCDYYKGCEYGIVMVDVSNLSSYEKHVEYLKSVNPNMHIMIVVNKYDTLKKKVVIDSDTFNGLEYVLMSVKSNFNISKPFSSIYAECKPKRVIIRKL